jgi:hypothetical protein
MATDIQELREASAWQWADAKAQIVALVTQLSRRDERMHDSNIIVENQRATIRAFASDTESIMTCSLLEPPRTPSLQVSTMVADSTRSASFVTAWTSVDMTVAVEENTVVLTKVMIVAIRYGGTVLRNTAYDISTLQSATVFANFGATGVRFYNHDQEWEIWVCSTGVQNDSWGSPGVSLLEAADKQGENMEVFRANHQQVTPRLTLWKTISRRILIPTWKRPSRRRT